jgi:methylmalonyl-CoA epimerase
MIDMVKFIEHVAITVKDFDRSLEWYVKNLGFSVKRLSENKEKGTKICFLQAGESMLELFGYTKQKVTLGPVLKDTETGIKHLCFTVDEDDVDNIIRRLKEEGTEFMSDNPKFPNFRDPNGIHIQLRPLKTSQAKE